MRATRLQEALERLTGAIRDVESELAAMKAEHDPLASHIFVSRRDYRNVSDTKSGKRREMTALSSFNAACELYWLWLLFCSFYELDDFQDFCLRAKLRQLIPGS